ncbi:hypothetical protein H6P81_016928 [Aristolochia fimbriata]|uniref:Disease resistance RPP13-like protein 1 n=1 Tax=Aristolochia fimbriata TaxID=158543 RepID=A0AAV7DXR8_ARIFI|nr:hypothetical protein H6P81_016928 [Aristolochia fimbriata]
MERGLESAFPSFLLAKIAMAAIIMTPLVDAELENLLSTLSAIRSTLADAEEKQAASNSVKDWLRKLRDVAHVVEDVVEEFAVEAARAKLEGAGYKIKNVRVMFEKIARERHDFNLKLGDGGKSAELKGILKTSSLIDESDVLGRNDDKEKLIELLLSDGCNGKPLSVFPIVGLGGLGKTTLARLVYNSRMVRERFQLLGWVCVSEDFDLVRITKGIVESLTRSKCELTEIDPLAHCVKDLLAGKIFLLVLDDVWNENCDYWEELRVPFTYGAAGSKMLVTSRSEKVARIMGTDPAYSLKVLPDKDCWELFTWKALMGEIFEPYPHLVEMGRKIVNKCQGLPLAIKILGGILSCKRSPKDWEEIYESPIWNLPEGENSIIPALRLSYHHLPAALKPCFSYCSLFPKDYMFNKDLLVQLWMGEGYIQPHGQREDEDVGSEYFHGLLMRSFFQPWERGLYKMHDLIHDLAEHVSEEEFSRVEEGKLPVKSTSVRHLSLILDPHKVRQFIVGTEAGMKITELKNLTNLNGEVRISRLENVVDGVESMQALLKLKQNLDEISFEWSNCLRDGCADMEVLEGLQPHFNLERLSIWKYVGFRLPSWLHNSLLYNLERLEVYSLAKCHILPPLGQLPSLKFLTLERMDSLKKLGQEIRGLGTGRGIPAFPKLKELFLEDLPKLDGWSGLHNGDMPCLDVLRIRMCPLLRHLPYLPPTLTELTIVGCDHLFAELRLPSLQRLELLRSNNILVRSVSHLTSLSSLEIADFDELHSLSDIKLPTSLTSIRISQCDNLEFLPKGMRNLTSLEYLLLRNCSKLANLPEDGLPASLQELCISDCSLLPIEPRLQDLSFLKYIKWEGFNRFQSLSDATLPSTLVSLSISSCENLESLPKDLNTLTYLQHLELYDCPRL